MTVLHQKGAGHIVAILAVVVIAVVGLAGYVVMGAQDNATSTNTATEKVTADQVELAETSKELDQANNELDESLDTTELDKDIDAML